MTKPSPESPKSFDSSPFSWAEVNGHSIRYSVEGTGEPVVLVHEMGGCIESWDDVARGLAATKTVIRYDQRSAGQSEKAVTGFTLGDLADDLESLIAGLGITEPVHLVGVAVGAAQAMLYAARHPQSVASLALLAPASDISPESRLVLETRSEQALASGMRSILGSSLDRAWPQERRTDEAAFQRFRGRYLAIDPKSFAQHNAALAGIDLGDTTSRISCPVLVIAGRHDRVRTLESMQAFSATLPTATLAVVDAAHFMAAEAPDEVLAELGRFYSGAQQRAPRHIDLPESQLSEAQADAIAEATSGTRGRVPAPMRAWLPSAEFARRAQSLGETLRYHTSLDPRLSELAILVTARLWRSDYEWRVHSAAAAQAGVSEGVIDSVRRGHVPEALDDDEQATFDVAVTLHREHRISDELFERATATLGRAGLAELVGILGYYTLVSMTLNAYDIDSPGEIDSPGALRSPFTEPATTGGADD